MEVLDPESVHRPSAGHSKQAHGKPRFGVSSVHGYSTCSVQKEHKDPGTTRWERAGGQGGQYNVHFVFHTTHCRPTHHRASVQSHACQTAPVPCQTWAVKERGMGLACCSQAICSSRAQSPPNPHS